jgi:ribonuclease P protein subunit RPR2
MRRTKPAWQVKIAKERIDILFREAATLFSTDPKLSNRYVFLARKLAMKYNIKLLSEYRRKYCHKCYTYLVPGENVKVRTNSKTQTVDYTCDCGHINRFGYSKEKK